MKTIVNILGATASGKSSLGRELMKGGVDHKVDINVGKLVTYGLAPSGFAIVGNCNSGTDLISSREFEKRIIEFLYKRADVKCIIMNVVACSRDHNVDFLNKFNTRVVHVFFNLTSDEFVKRLRARRAARGKSDTDDASRGGTFEKSVANQKDFIRRAAGVAAYARQALVAGRDTFIELKDKDSVKTATKKVMAVL